MGLWSCEPVVENVNYEEKLVVFCNLEANLPIARDTVFVTQSHGIDESHEDNEKWVSGATVEISTGERVFDFREVDELPGRYLCTDSSYVVESGVVYMLNVATEDHEVSASTEVPGEIRLESVANDSLWECEGNTVVEAINIYPFTLEELFQWQTTGSGDPAMFRHDTVTYRTADCYTSSFTSMPYFIVHWQTDSEPGIMRSVTLALEDTVSNVIIDTTFSAHAFKGHMLIDEEGNKYWMNPMVWNFIQREIFYGWIAFGYYGLHLIMIQATDQAFAEYYAGDPLGINQFIAPNTNIENGLGLFSSTTSAAFFVYVAPESPEP